MFGNSHCRPMCALLGFGVPCFNTFFFKEPSGNKSLYFNFFLPGYLKAQCIGPSEFKGLEIVGSFQFRQRALQVRRKGLMGVCIGQAAASTQN